MQTILVLGSSSAIGEALAKKFSYGNHIILSGRNQAKLDEVAKNCLICGALSTAIVAVDLSKSVQPILEINIRSRIDLVIDAASTASRSRDSNITEIMMEEIIYADLTSHLALYTKLHQQNHEYPNIIFISSVLAIIKTPDKEIYSMLKRLLEIYFLKLMEAHPLRKILIFRIAKEIPRINNNQEAEKLAQKVQKAYDRNCEIEKYGLSGEILNYANLIHPILTRVMIAIKRRGEALKLKYSTKKVNEQTRGKKSEPL